ncbi:MAG: hypothetical protein KKF62_18500 [Bacteroidetes bacterium]|nr:hypothetical protein [Bacteroidota bacterium]MBU1114375.1 hypothetical protein [Bacteroidota bacterium]MBU1798330.1 hypothetical protein [Bacteroidota bacterium]
MKIDAYFRFERIKLESKTRYDLTFNQGSYSPLQEINKNGECWIYFSKSLYIQFKSNRKTDSAISTRERHITSVFIPEIEKPNFGFGDFDNDAFLIVVNGTIEILVFKGKKHIQSILNNLFLDGEFDEALEEFRTLSTLSKKTQLNLVKNVV